MPFGYSFMSFDAMSLVIGLDKCPEKEIEMANSKIGGYLLEYLLIGFGDPANEHKLRCNVMAASLPAVGAAPSTIDILQRGTTSDTLDNVANQVWSYLSLKYSSGITAASYSLWYWTTNNARDWISGGVLDNPAGTGGGSLVTNWQTTLTFRTGGNGIGKLVFIESTGGGNQRNALVPEPEGTPEQRIAAFAISSDSPFMGLDNGFFVSPLRDNRGENESVRNKRLGV